MTELLYSDLVFDNDVYPREEVDQGHVEHLKDVLAAGKKLPKIRVEKGTNRVVDGYHRAEAHRAHRGVSAVIEVDECEYESVEALLLDAIRANATHGRPFSLKDRSRAVALATRAGVSVEAIANVLNVNVGRVTALAQTRVATVARPTARRAGASRVSSASPRPEPSDAAARINSLARDLKDKKIDVSDKEIERSLRSLVKVIVERLRPREQR